MKSGDLENDHQKALGQLLVFGMPVPSVLITELETRLNRGQASEEEIAACMSAEIMCLASMTHGL